MNAETIAASCSALEEQGIESARQILQMRFPFERIMGNGRSYTRKQKTKLFLRDGFIDRYSGDKLIFPPVLKILSNLMPDVFPYHKNWKTDQCHMAYWKLYPTIDHIVPVTRGGEDREENWACTSQLRNSAKSNWMLSELGWSLHEPGSLKEWDGLLGWFIKYVNARPEQNDDPFIRSWYAAATGELKKGDDSCCR